MFVGQKYLHVGTLLKMQGAYLQDYNIMLLTCNQVPSDRIDINRKTIRLAWFACQFI